jgi:hypothetical protein
MIDNNGAWAKIEGRQWFGSNIFKSCTKPSLSKRLFYFQILFSNIIISYKISLDTNDTIHDLCLSIHFLL